MDEWRSLRKDGELDRHWRYVYTLTREMADDWEAALRRYVDLLREGYSVTAAYQAVEARDPLGLLSQLPFGEAERLAMEMARPLAQQIAARAGAAEFMRLSIPLSFTLDNPYSTRFAYTHTAQLVQQVTEETRAAIRQVIGQAFEAGLPPRRAAIRIREMVGLTERDAGAVMRYWRTLTEETDLSASRVDELADSYSRKLLRRRALTIARTETIASSASGTQESWQMARDHGFLPYDVKQEWIAAMESRRTCPTCRDLDGQQVPIGQPFQSGAIGALSGPPAHPACRCAVGAVTSIPATKRYWAIGR